METIVGVYDSHEKALDAVKKLQGAGFPVKQVSLVSKAELSNDHIHIKTGNAIEKAEVSVGVVAGSILGILTGVGIFAIPGLGFLFGAGALVGAIAGLEFGVVGGGIVAILTSIGVDEAVAAKYQRHLNEGKFLVLAQGNEQEIKKAHEVLHTANLELELDSQ